MRIYFPFLLAVIFLNTAHADSLFDCSNTTSSLEKIICADQNLADLNAISNELFLKSKQLDSQNSGDINKSLYFNLRKCNDENDCLNKSYQDAISSYRDLITRNIPLVIEEKIDQTETRDETQLVESKNEDAREEFYTRISTNISNWVDSLSFGDWLIITLLILAFIYFLPTIIAFNRGHRNRWIIFIVNIVFGCTFLGWIVALIWALNKIDDPVKGGVKHDSQPHDPVI